MYDAVTLDASGYRQVLGIIKIVYDDYTRLLIYLQYNCLLQGPQGFSTLEGCDYLPVIQALRQAVRVIDIVGERFHFTLGKRFILSRISEHHRGVTA